MTNPLDLKPLAVRGDEAARIVGVSSRHFRAMDSSNARSDGTALMERLLNKKEAAYLLGVSTRSVDYLVTSGQLSRVLITKRPGANRGAVRFQPADVRSYIAGQVQGVDGS